MLDVIEKEYLKAIRQAQDDPDKKWIWDSKLGRNYTKEEHFTEKLAQYREKKKFKEENCPTCKRPYGE